MTSQAPSEATPVEVSLAELCVQGALISDHAYDSLR